MACEGNLAQGAPSEGHYMQYSIFPKVNPFPGDVLEPGAATRLFILAVIARTTGREEKLCYSRFMITTAMYISAKRVRT